MIRYGLFLALAGFSLVALGTDTGHSGESGTAAEGLACQLRDVNLTSEESLSGRRLSYFISSVDDAVMMISNGNYIKMQGSDHQMKLPGPYDAVASPDGKYYSVPTGGLTFYDLHATKEEAKAGKSRTELSDIGRDPDFGESYQSLGAYQKDGKTIYRALSVSHLRDYTAGADGRIAPVDSASGAPRACKNLAGMRLQLPMISKDGQYLSTYNMDTQTTVIYRISPENPSNCEKVIDLGMPTGKVDFNADSSKITFHVDNLAGTHQSFGGLSREYSKDVMVMQLKKGPDGLLNGIDGYARLSTNVKGGTGTYYPRFRMDGSIVAMRDRGDGNGHSLAYFSTKNLKFADPWSPKTANGTEASRGVHAEYALSDLWRKTCGSSIPSATQARWLALSLDPTGCRLLIEREWETHKAAVLSASAEVAGLKAETLQSLTKEDLLAICPPATQATDAASGQQPTPPPPNASSSVATMAPPRPLGELMRASDYAALSTMFQANCAQCHTAGVNVPGARAFDLENLDAATLQTASVLINAGIMPKGKTLSESDRTSMAAVFKTGAEAREAAGH
jgi:mono/diheme cytochrome c family protein